MHSTDTLPGVIPRTDKGYRRHVLTWHEACSQYQRMVRGKCCLVQKHATRAMNPSTKQCYKKSDGQYSFMVRRVMASTDAAFGTTRRVPGACTQPGTPDPAGESDVCEDMKYAQPLNPKTLIPEPERVILILNP
eukprot:1861091-Rhodomonas_salina.1